MKYINLFFALLFIFILSFRVKAQPSPVLQQVAGLSPSQGKIQIVFSAVNKDICWGCNYYNTQFIRTTDGGANWTVSNVINDNSLVCQKIAAINVDTAFIVLGRNILSGSAPSSNKGIYKTSDGGSTWTRYANAYNDASSDPLQIYFFDSNHGVSVGQPVGGNWEIYTTSNGGTDWNRVPSANIPKPLSGETAIEGYPGSANGIDNSFWFGTFGPSEYGTSDCGNTWFVTRNMGHVATVSFKDSLNGIAENLHGYFSTTSDGGHTWQPAGNFTSVSPLGLAYIKGTDNSYLMNSAYNKRTSSELTNPGTAYSSDGGRTWKMLDKLPNQWPSFAPDGTGWSAGINDSVYKWIGFSTETAVNDGMVTPINYGLSQNFPNPFNPSTTIKYSLPKASFVTLKVYDLLGREIATLVNEEKPAGNFEINFDAYNLSSGVYFYKINAEPVGKRAGSFIKTKKLLLMK